MKHHGLQEPLFASFDFVSNTLEFIWVPENTL